MNIGIDKIGNLEFIENMFKELNCIGNTNCFLLALNRNFVPNSLKGFSDNGMANAGQKVGGIVGGMIGSSISEGMNELVNESMNSLDNKNIKLVLNNDLYGFIINVTEYGIGFVPLTNDTMKLSNCKAHPESFTYLTYNLIKSTKLKKIPFNFGRRVLYITWNDGMNPRSVLTIRMKDKLIKYQATNYKEFTKIYETIKKED